MNCREPKGRFGSWLSEKLTEAGMKESEIANELGLTRVSISNHIRGGICPHTSTIKMYANYFGIPWQTLYEMVLEDSKERNNYTSYNRAMAHILKGDFEKWRSRKG